MGTYFIDFEGFLNNDGDIIIKELCIMDANNILNPFHNVYRMEFPPNPINSIIQSKNLFLITHHHHLRWFEGNSLQNIYDQYSPNSIYYTLDTEDGNKIKTLQIYFPKMRIANYAKTIFNLPIISPNISCIWHDHGPNCEYKSCLAMAIDYCKSY